MCRFKSSYLNNLNFLLKVTKCFIFYLKRDKINILANLNFAKLNFKIKPFFKSCIIEKKHLLKPLILFHSYFPERFYPH